MTEKHKEDISQLNNFQKKEGFYIDYSEIQEVVKNETGKFAIEYK